MLRYQFSPLGMKEARLILREGAGFFQVLPSPKNNPRQQESRERMNPLQLSGVPNELQRYLNETSQRIGKTRAQYLKDLRQLDTYLSAAISKMRHPFGLKAPARRGYRPPGFGLNTDARSPHEQERIARSEATIQPFEIMLDDVRKAIVLLQAEEAAHLPDVVEAPPPVPQEKPTATQPKVEATTVLGTGERPAPRTHPPAPSKEAREAVSGIPEQLQEIGARLWDSLPEEESREAMRSLCTKMKEADEETLRAFFRLYFNPDGTERDLKEVTINKDLPLDVEAEKFSNTLSPAERAVATEFMKKVSLTMEKAPTFEAMTQPTKERIKKYIERWNKAEVDSADKLIAEGMLYLDGVDVEKSMKGGKIDKDKIVLLGSNERFMGIISGWIKLIMGWKKLFGGMTKGAKGKEVVLRELGNMRPDEREAEVIKNKKNIKEIDERNKASSEKIKELEEKRDKPGIGDDERRLMEDEIATLKKWQEEGKKKIEELKERNKGLEGVKSGNMVNSDDQEKKANNKKVESGYYLGEIVDENVIHQLKSKLARQLSVNEADITTLRQKNVQWPNSSLGWESTGTGLSIDTLVLGILVTFSVSKNGVTEYYEFHHKDANGTQVVAPTGSETVDYHNWKEWCEKNKTTKVMHSIETFKKRGTILIMKEKNVDKQISDLCESNGLKIRHQDQRHNYIVCSWEKNIDIEKILLLLVKEPGIRDIR